MRMLAIEASFGLNPSDRSRLKVTEEEVDEFERYMREKSK